MPIVSNTSPLLNLAIIGELGVVRDQFERVLVPPAVVNEFRLEKERPGSSALRREVEEGWIEIQEPNEEALIRTLRQDLDGGEAEAIALAVEKNAGHVLIDEREGRRRARKVGLEVTGVLGILLRAAKEGALESLADALDELEEEAGFWISPSLRRQILDDPE
jgi:predicted nucleic acid-binding protein